MQLTRFADYSLRVLIYLAQHAGVQATIRDIADAHSISENHLMKVVQSLARQGYVRTTRGKGGGIRLARAAADISVGHVLRDVEPLTPVECFQDAYDGKCILFPDCALRGALSTAQARYLEALDDCTISELITPPKRSVSGASRPPVRRVNGRSAAT